MISARPCGVNQRACLVSALAPNTVYRSSQIFSLAHSPRTIVDLRRPKDPPIANLPGDVRIVRLPLVGGKAGLMLLANLPFRVLIDFVSSGDDAVIGIYPPGEFKLITQGRYYFNSPDATVKMYCLIVHYATAEMREICQLVADKSNLPVHFHCVAGKDRTGIVSMLLARLVDGDVDEIAKDYAASYHNLREAREQGMFDASTALLMDEALIQSKWETCVAVLRTVDTKYGGVRNYFVNHCRMDERTVDAARENLRG